MCIYITIHYERFSAAGFPSPDDNDALECFENHLAEVCDGQQSTFVATVFMPGIKDFIVYTSEPDELSSKVESLVKTHQQFKVEFGGHIDPEWTQYEAFA